MMKGVINLSFIQGLKVNGSELEFHDVEFIKSTVDRDTLLITAHTKMLSNQLFEGMQVALVLDKDLNAVSSLETKYVKVKIIFNNGDESQEIPVYINSYERLSGNDIRYYIIGSCMRLVYVVENDTPMFLMDLQIVNIPGMVIDNDGVVSIS